jgi:hypothetical protein
MHRKKRIKEGYAANWKMYERAYSYKVILLNHIAVDCQFGGQCNSLPYVM